MSENRCFGRDYGCQYKELLGTQKQVFQRDERGKCEQLRLDVEKEGSALKVSAGPSLELEIEEALHFQRVREGHWGQ
jgi:hypothetical protein